MNGTISAAEFAEIMAPLGPWPAGGQVAVAVSGGADSLCLAYLLADWGTPFALIVDHGLRPESPAEAALTAKRLRKIDIPARILTLHTLHAGPGLAIKARQARYAALQEAALQEGLADLLVAHHLRDQAETFLMRQRRVSGPAGLASMPAVTETHRMRIVRPLLNVPPGRLRATLRAAGLDWVEDPSNARPDSLRAQLRAELADMEGDSALTRALADEAATAGRARASADAAESAWLARNVSIFPEGYAVARAPIPAGPLAALIRALGGNLYPSGGDALERLAARMEGVLGGVRLLPAGRLRPGTLLVREAACMGNPVPALPGAVWDGRFRFVSEAPPGAWLGALGADSKIIRPLSPLPSAVLQTLPALRLDGQLIAIPHISKWGPEGSGAPPPVAFFCPRNPARPAPWYIALPEAR